MKKKKITAVLLPAALALVLAGGIHVGEALAYFTACTSASGRVQVGLNFPLRIPESVSALCV